jgi:teichoic acid transport system permease protein
VRFFRDLKKYHRYITYSAGAILRSEVAGSYLSWAWWVLDPLLFMLVYTFVAQVVFRTRIQYFPIFVFIGLAVWNFFEKNLVQSVSLLKANRGIITRVYLPKQILLLQRMAVNGVKMLITFLLILGMMLLFGVDFTWQILWLLPHLALLFLLVFAAGSWCLHLGVFVEDLQNVSTVLLKLMFYFSGVFYDITTMVPAPYNRWLITLNPVALVMQGCRGAILYRTGPDWGYLLGWTAVALLAAAGGTAMVYRYENSYGKVL